MNRRIGILVIVLFASSYAAADQDNFRCYKSVGLKNTLRIQFVIQSDNDDVGYVVYEGGSAPIPVKRLKEGLKRPPGGRPSVFETVGGKSLLTGPVAPMYMSARVRLYTTSDTSVMMGGYLSL